MKIEGLRSLEMYAASSEWNHHTHRLMVRVFTGAEALLTLQPQSQKIKTLEEQGWGDGLEIKGFATQAGRPGFHSQNLPQKAGCGDILKISVWGDRDRRISVTHVYGP